MSDMPPPQPPISSSGPVPTGPPSAAAPFGQSPFGATASGPTPSSTSWQPAPGGGWSAASQSGGGGAGVKIAVVIALVAVVALAVGAVFALGGGDDSEASPTTEPSEQSVAPDEDDEEPATDTVATPETAAPAATDVPATAPPLSVPGPVDLFADGQARAMVAEVAEARGADPLRVLKAAIYPTYSFVQVQDPSRAENVDEYAWRDGRLQGDPAPVRLVGDGDLEANLFSSDEVRWNTIPRLVAGAVEATGVEDGEVSHVIVQRDLPFSDAVVIRVYVTGPRQSGFLEADANGDVIEVNVG